MFDALQEHDPEPQRKPNILGPHAVSAFCDAIGHAPDSFAVLVVAWKMGAAKMGFFTREEFVDGMVAMGFSQEGLGGLADWGAESLPAIEAQLLADPLLFEELYMYAFAFGCEPGQKSMGKDAAALMLRVVLPQGTPHLDPFLAFLHHHSTRGLTRDQWRSFLEFAHAYPNEQDLDTYDDTEAWPVLLDDYVTHHHSQSPTPP